MPERSGLPYLEIEALIERGKLRLEINDNKGAEKDLKKAITLCERTGFKLYLPAAEEALRELQ